MKNYIGIMAGLILMISGACDKDNENEWINRGNQMRVSRVTGHSELWGDFCFKCGYQKERFDTAGIYSTSGKKSGNIEAVYKGNTSVFVVTKRVPAVDEETAAGMHPDSIPLYTATLYQVTCTVEDGWIKTAAYTCFGPRVQEQGEEFQPGYEVKSKENYLFEYDDRGRVVKWRSPGSYQFYDPIYKGEIAYSGNRLTGITNFVYQGDQWVTVSQDVYTWDRDLLIKIVGNSRKGSFERSFTYTGDKVSHISFKENDSSKEITYTYNPEGFVTKIDEGDGNYMTIEYEAGNGNFSLFTPLLDQISGIPYIK